MEVENRQSELTENNGADSARPVAVGRRPHRTRRGFLQSAGMALALAGCGNRRGEIGKLDRIWGKRGLMPGQFTKPRAVAIDGDDNLYIVDMRAMIQVFDVDGNYLRQWETPTHANGRPSGLAFDREGRLLVADSHYHRILFYDKFGSLLRTLAGDEGTGPLIGEFGYVGDVAVDSQGMIYIAESQVRERISKVTPSGSIVKQWGTRGIEPGQFQKIRSMCFDRNDRLFVADACNHRVQIFDPDGNFLRTFGEPGTGLGQLDFPYDVSVADDSNIYVCEYGKSRVQKFNADGKSLGVWGHPGRGEGELWNPWALGLDSKGRVHVIDSNSHRIQRVIF